MLNDRSRINVFAVSLALALLACSLPGSSIPLEEDAQGSPPPPEQPATPVPVATQSLTPTPERQEHRIGIRTIDGEAEFFDRVTGERFVPRGANFHRWIRYDVPDLGPSLMDSTFNTAYGQLQETEPHLQAMQASGYNVIRMWANACWGGSPGCIVDAGPGLDASYLENIAEFLRMAQAHGLYVMLTFDDLPERGSYRPIMDRDCCQEWEGYNLDYLSPGGVEANRLFWRDFIAGLLDAGAPMEPIFSFQLRNESFFESNLAPLDRESGVVTAANGESYDLAVPEERRQMMEAGWLHWIETMVGEIKSQDPTALVTMGFFVQQEPNPVRVGDTRLVYTERVLKESALDFLDFHAYPGFDLSMLEHAENFAMTDYVEKPIIMGEFGAHIPGYPSVAAAAAVLQAWQVDSCASGFDGWLLWTWGGADAVDEFWAGVDGEGAIERALAPSLRPDPCAPGVEMTQQANLAWGKSAAASRFETGGWAPRPPRDAFDLSHNSYWSAGEGPPQWIEVDLEEPAEVGRLRLIAYFPGVGRFVIRVAVGGPDDSSAQMRIHTFDVVNDDPDVMILEVDFEPPLDRVQLVRVQTVTAPGWVLWHEIEVLPPGS